jgi:hypothetical protein
MRFKEFLNKENKINEAMNREFDFNLTVVTFLTAVAQFHVWHLLTKDAHIHEAIKEFYEGLQDATDVFTEAVLGKYYSQGSADATKAIFFIFDSDVVQSELRHLGSLVTDSMSQFNDNDDFAIIDALGNIKEHIAKLQYKLKLK